MIKLNQIALPSLVRTEVRGKPKSPVRPTRSISNWVDQVSGLPQRGMSTGLMTGSGRVSRVSPVQTAMRNCTRDEGRSFEAGGNSHAAFDVAGTGDVAWSRWCDTRKRKGETTENTNFGLHRRASPRPYLGARGVKFLRATRQSRKPEAAAYGLMFGSTRCRHCR